MKNMEKPLRGKWYCDEEKKKFVEEGEREEKPESENLKEEFEKKREAYKEALKEANVAEMKKDKKLRKAFKDREFFDGIVTDYAKHLKELEGAEEEKKEEVLKNIKEWEKSVVENLKKKGFSEEQAKKILEAQMKKAEMRVWEGKVVETMKKEGKGLEEVFKFFLANREWEQKLEIEQIPPREKSLLTKAFERYAKLPLGLRLAITTGIVTGAVALTGGFSAPALAVFAGYRYARGLGAVLAGKGVGLVVGRLGGKYIMRSHEKRLAELKTKITEENLELACQEYQKILQERLKKERILGISKLAVAVATGIGAGFGLRTLADPYLHEVFHPPTAGTYPPEETGEKPGGEIGKPGGEKISKTGIGVVEKMETGRLEVLVKPGDNLWKIIERQLEQTQGERFTNLPEARKTYIIDALKDKVAQNPEKFGLKDIDFLRPGQKIDLTEIFKKEEVENAFDRAMRLTAGQMESVEHNNRVLLEWVKTHPGQSLTSEKVEEILRGAKIKTSEEILKGSQIEVPPEVPPEKPQVEIIPSEVPPEKPQIETIPPEAPPEKPQVELQPSQVSPLEEKLKAEMIMDLNEKAAVGYIGFSPAEWEAIKNVKVKEILEQIPEDRRLAWDIWGGNVEGKEIKLPFATETPLERIFGGYGPLEFKKHLRLAELIRSYRPGQGELELSVRDFFRMRGPAGIVELPEK